MSFNTNYNNTDKQAASPANPGCVRKDKVENFLNALEQNMYDAMKMKSMEYQFDFEHGIPMELQLQDQLNFNQNMNSGSSSQLSSLENDSQTFETGNTSNQQEYSNISIKINDLNNQNQQFVWNPINTCPSPIVHKDLIFSKRPDGLSSNYRVSPKQRLESVLFNKIKDNIQKNKNNNQVSPRKVRLPHINNEPRDLKLQINQLAPAPQIIQTPTINIPQNLNMASDVRSQLFKNVNMRSNVQLSSKTFINLFYIQSQKQCSGG